MCPDKRSDRQKPHSPERHLEGGARLALSKATRIDSVEIAGISLIKPPIFTFTLNVVLTIS